MTQWNYLYIFMQSNLIEILCFYLFYRGLASFQKTFALVTLSNSITHPIVFFGFMSAGLTYLTAILLAETFAVLAEAFLHFYFGRISLRRAFTASLVSNVTSWQLAPLLTYLLFF